MDVSFETDLSDFCSEFSRLESWKPLAFLKRQLHFTVFGKSRSLHFPRYASLGATLPGSTDYAMLHKMYYATVLRDV